MIYQKNLYGWEQILRLAAGLLIAGAGLWWWPGSVTGYLVAVAGVGFALTGAFGFCPMCAMAGRQLKGGDAAR